jgi:hypothetical protein
VEDTPPRSEEGRALLALQRPAHRCSGVSQMLLYVETWLPLLSVAVTAAILCGVFSFIMGRAER